MRCSEPRLVLTATFSGALARFQKEDNPFVFQEKFSADYRSECPSPGQRPWPSFWLCCDLQPCRGKSGAGSFTFSD